MGEDFLDIQYERTNFWHGKFVGLLQSAVLVHILIRESAKKLFFNGVGGGKVLATKNK